MGILMDGFVPTRSRLKVVLADLVEELATSDAEALGDLVSVAAAGQQGTLNCAPFHIGKQCAQRQGLGSVRRHG